MRRFSFLLLALLITWAGTHLIATTDNFAAYVLRDGLLLALVGMVIFALQGLPIVAATSDDAASGTRFYWGLLVFVLLIGAGLRLVQLTQLPPDCIASECDRALQLSEHTAGSTLLALLARLFYAQSSDALWSLRLSSALLGSMTILALAGAVQPLTSRSGALLAAALLALNPWHIAASRTADLWITIPLLLCVLFWLLATAWQTRKPLWWLAVLVSLFLLYWNSATLPWGLGHPTGDWRAALVELLTQLLRGTGEGVTAFFSAQPLLGAFSGALMLLGLATLLRQLRASVALIWLVGWLVATLVVLRCDWTATPLSSLALTLLPFCFAAIAVATDQLLGAFLVAWQSVIRPSVAITAAMALVLLGAGSAALAFTGQLGSLPRAGQSAAMTGMSQWLAQQLKEHAADSTFFVPNSVLNSPITRLLAGSALQTAHIQPLEGVLDWLLANQPNDNLRLAIPPAQQRLLGVLTRFYPNGAQEIQRDPEKQEVLFTTLAVTAQELAAQRGLTGHLATDTGEQRLLPSPPALQFDWANEHSLTTTFSVLWQGALRVPATGAYGFAVEGVGPGEAVFNLQLDGLPILDTARGQLNQNIPLAQGFYRLEMAYRPQSAPTARPMPLPALIVRWQRPDAAWETLPANMLLNTPLPVMGLLGTYYGNAQWQEPGQEQRKDLVIAPPATLKPPYSVRWQGKVAAPRAGEYLFGIVSDGISQLTIDGQQVVNALPGADANTVTTYTEGLIYLHQGWHDLEVRYAPGQTQPDFQLLWQPAGSAPGPVDNEALAPLLLTGNGAVRPLPPPPPLLDPHLGDERFALAQPTTNWQPQVRIPPMNLPTLPFTLLWQLNNGCGNGEGQLNQPHGVLIDEAGQQVYVADTANRRVARFNLAGQPVGFLQHEQFQEPADLAVAPDGALLILDDLAQQIFRVDPTTQQIAPLALGASFYRPRGFTVDAQGNIDVADTGGGRIALLDANGQALGEIGGRNSPLGKGQPVDVWAAPGALWAISAEDGRLWRLEANGSMTAIQRVDTINGPQLAGLPTGVFFLSDPARGLVAYHTANGQPVAQFVNRDSFARPTGISAAQREDQVQLAIVDNASCTLSLWQMPLSSLPQ